MGDCFKSSAAGEGTPTVKPEGADWVLTAREVGASSTISLDPDGGRKGNDSLQWSWLSDERGL